MSEMAGLSWAACVVMGLGAAVLGWWMVDVLRTEDLQQGAEWRYDVSRINELRRIDPFYRIFQPVIHLLARLNRSAFRDEKNRASRQLDRPGGPMPSR